MFESIPYYLGFGGLAGLLSGLLGIGGGVVIVPFLIWRLAEDGFTETDVMVVAVATSLATIVFTSISSVYAHHRLGAVNWAVVGRMAPGIMAGSVVGSVIAERLPAHWFKLAFASFLLFVGSRMARRAVPAQTPAWRLTTGGLGAAGTGIGLLSAILGIGGGTLSVPLLARCGHPIAQAVAISGALGCPIALAGAATYILLGWHQPGLPPFSLGYVYLPAFGGLILTSVLFAPLGARLAHRMPANRLRRVFALAILAIGGKLLWQAIGQIA